ncbi:hypothetical protein J3R83DRAFT_12555, partial [Lanmaoa asiatica]
VRDDGERWSDGDGVVHDRRRRRTNCAASDRRCDSERVNTKALAEHKVSQHGRHDQAGLGTQQLSQ